MGRIKTALIKRTGKQLIEKTPDSFSPSFTENKKSLGSNTMPGKRVRNMVAGYISRIKKNTKSILEEKEENGQEN
jgi:small subunit ribosomal protein S17e